MARHFRFDPFNTDVRAGGRRRHGETAFGMSPSQVVVERYLLYPDTGHRRDELRDD